MTKEQVQATEILAIIEQIQLIERFGATDAMLEAFETFAGVMYEQASLIALSEHSQEKELKEWGKKVISEGRVYSSHFVAIRDALRLCKLIKELEQQVNDFIEGGGEDLLKSVQNKEADIVLLKSKQHEGHITND